MKAPTVFLCGVVASIIVILVSSFIHLLGLHGFQTLTLLGSLATARIDQHTAWVGILVFALFGGVWAFGYAFIFWSAHRSGAYVGLNLSFFHWLISGFVAGLIPAIHPLVPEVMAAPGFFYLSFGFVAALEFFLAHLLFGATIGYVFDIAAQRRERPRPITGSAEPHLNREWRQNLHLTWDR